MCATSGLNLNYNKVKKSKAGVCILSSIPLDCFQGNILSREGFQL